jgi:hypothetical protein
MMKRKNKMVSQTKDWIKKNVLTFTYHGSDKMITFKKTIPKVHKDFKCTFKLKNGKEIKATGKSRERIWKFWYNARENELANYIINESIRTGARRIKLPEN